MKKVAVNVNQVIENNREHIDFCVGGGRAYETLVAENQRQLKTAVDECGFTHLRFHGIFNEDMAVCIYDREGKLVYNWQYVDLLYDYMMSIGVRPIVELGFMPYPLASGGNTIFFWRGNVTPPRDYNQWYDFIQAFVQHLTDRYGAEELEKNWMFEIWNEPNLKGFWAAEYEDYIKLYDTTAKAVKSVNEKYAVGGPVSAGIAWIPEFIQHCYDNQVPLDFITAHTYGVEGCLDEFGKDAQIMFHDENSVTYDVKLAHQQISESPMPHLPLYITEWGPSYSSRDNVHDAYHAASFILTRLHDCAGYTKAMSHWTFSDIFEEAGPGPKHFHGGFGLMNIQGLKKPSFFAYKYLHMLGDTCLACEDKYTFAAKNDQGVQVLTWDYTMPDQNGCSNQDYYIKDLPAPDKGTVSVQVSGLEDGVYTVTTYGIGYRMNDVYTEYLSMPQQGTLSAAQIDTLKAKCSGAPIAIATAEAKDGVLTVERPIRENDVFLFTIEKKA